MHRLEQGPRSTVGSTGAKSRVVVRTAQRADLKAIEELDRLCFLTDEAGVEPTADGEIAYGLDRGQVLIAAEGAGGSGKLLGYVQVFTVQPSRQFFVSSLAVHPDVRGLGIGTTLVSACIGHLPRSRVFVSCTTRPDNYGAIVAFLKNGFVVSRLIPEYFGTSKDRFYLEWTDRPVAVRSGRSVLVPVGQLAYLASLLDRDPYRISSFVATPHGPCFQVDEVAASMLGSASARGRATRVKWAAVAFTTVAAETFVAILVSRLLSRRRCA